jgi:alginate O-acetyltransferase complex protein AlgI
MLFNSYVFIFVFLPIAVTVFYWIGRTSALAAAAWLAVASLFFYGWWNPAFVGLLIASIVVNYGLGVGIARLHRSERRRSRNGLLALGVGVNLLVLAYFKYAGFFLVAVGALDDAPDLIGGVGLPLAISFFTFTQIAFLVDAARGRAEGYNAVHYGLFVTFFPHLIAGPLYYHREIIPQFDRPGTYRFSFENIAVGVTLFAAGLFKKVVLADGIAPFVGPAFDGAGDPTLLAAWGGALAYTLQLYFDFSGYSDMAIGAARLFGITLPVNFHSPYKAVNIIEFWRRWHMTLSRFLRDFLYIPLGGNRKGPSRRTVNIMTTMLLGGLWHGAGWTFVVWGGLHGVYLLVNRAWQAGRRGMGHDLTRSTPAGRTLSRAVTFIAVVVGWVFFRAGDVASALSMLKGMVGMNGVAMPGQWRLDLGPLGDRLATLGVQFPGTVSHFLEVQVIWTAVLLAIVWLLPNTQQLLSDFHPALNVPADDPAHPPIDMRWRPSVPWALAGAAALGSALAYMTRTTEYLYFQF